eukprot:2099916-Prymnesium_polylepis.1
MLWVTSNRPNALTKMLTRHVLLRLVGDFAKRSVYNECHKEGAFPPGFADGIVTSMYKKNDRTDPRNDRPITLLNGDYGVRMFWCTDSARGTSAACAPSNRDESRW